ncbi:MAG: exodeoxyribonuclease VII large subunit [Mollicutes bacterium]|nr:exodeoxyribonuclease VII large subunit [Mollicutes bacterium]
MNREYISISDINRIIKFTIDNNESLRSVYIKGEISNLKFHSRGHLYFSLKDENSKINAVMFNYNRYLNFVPKDGDSVLVHGKVSVYEATGSYQIYVDDMLQDGLGNLYQLFEELKKKLSSEGLFNTEHKKKINRLPRKIGVITAPTGAAVRDVISTINKRYPLVEIYVFPTLVQGEDASKNIVRMIELANTYPLDTIILGRGGGSIEDLWAFNEEIVARAIYKSKIPIISGVGHEIDFTISDFVADLRAPTPTGAAILATSDKEDILKYLKTTKERVNNAILNRLYSYNELIKKYKSNYILNNPMRLYDIKEQKLDILYDRINTNIRIKLDNSYKIIDKYKSNYILNNPRVLYENKFDKLSSLSADINSSIKRIIENNGKRLDTLKIKLELLNPKNVLDKGYSILYKDGKIIKNTKDIVLDDNLNVIISDGNIDVIVKGVNK